MVQQHHRRYLRLEASPSSAYPRSLWQRAGVRESQGQPRRHGCVVARPFRKQQRRRGVWQYTVWITLVVIAMAAARGSMAQEPDAAVDYQIANGAISQALTEQPGDPERGRLIVLDREGGDCTICHAMPLPQRQFHGSVGAPLDGIGGRYSAGELRLRLVDPKAFNPETIMPAYYKIEGLHRVLERYRGKPLLTAQQVEDVLAYLLTLRAE
jgi:L-cysteine S-thiosulfotransferase